jgi:hypothetical protein
MPCPESYFMTIQDQDAVLGRVRREQRELQDTRSALEAEAQRLGRILVSLGETLGKSPGRIALAGEAVPERLTQTAHVIQQSDLDEIAGIPKLTANYREIIRRLQENDRLLKGDAYEI